MAEVNINLKCDLQHAVKVQYLDGNLFSQDAAANIINIEVTDGGAPATIGGTVSANVIRPDGGTVAVTGGTISGNIVSITLPAACYALVGMITIVVKLSSDSVVTTLAAAVAYVYQSSTDTVVDPGTVVSSIQDLIDAIDTAVASIPADYSSLWTKLAPAFSSSTAYTAGQYVTYNGGLYRFTKAHAAGSWASGDVVAVNLGGELSDVKSAISDITGNAEIPVTETGKYIDMTGATANVGSPSTSANFKYSIVSCSPGDKFTVTAVSAGAARAWGFLGSSYNVLSKAAEGAEPSELVLTAPTGSAYFVINNRVTNSYLSYYGEVLKKTVKNVNDRVTETNNKIGVVDDVVNIVPITSGYTQYAGFWKAADNSYNENTVIVTRVVTVEADTQYYYTGRNLGSAGYYGVVFFDANNSVIGGECISSSTQVNYARRKVMPPSTASKIGFTATKESAANEANAYLFIEKSANYLNDNDQYGGEFGFSNTGIEENVFYHIPIYGQSLSTGADAPYYNDGTMNGLFMCGTLESPSANLVPLQLTSGTMNPIVSALHDFKKIADQNGHNHYMVATSSGRGGRSIAQLMSAARQAEIKTARGYDYSIDADSTLQYEQWKTDCTIVKAVVSTRLNRTVKCPVIVFIQGERDFYTDAQLIAASAEKPHAYAAEDNKAYYKSYMSMLKSDMQSYIKTLYGQTETPLFAIYPCSGDFIYTTKMGVTMAQVEFAAENDDVILLAPHYPMPNYNNGHLSTNGYRWYGEYIGQALADALIKRDKPKELVALNGYVNGKSAYIQTDGGRLPLVFDTYTVQSKTNYGFKMYVNGAEVTVSSVEIKGNLIVLTTTSSMDAAEKVEVTYAQNVFGGHGNVRDTSPYQGQFAYLDDSQDKGTSGTLSIVYSPVDASGNSLVGEKYPMHKWLVPFYLKIVG